MTGSATGAQARVRMLFEATYGVAPSDDFWNMPFQPPFTLGASQNLIDDPLLGQGRDRLDPSKDAIDVAGDIAIPVDARYFGLWLTLLLGDPDTTHPSGHYQHIFTSGADSLPSASIELAHPNAGRYLMNTGVMANTLGLNFTRTGQASATVGLIGQNETPDNASGAGTPDDLALTRFSQFNGVLKRNGTQIGKVLSASMTYSNGLEGIPVISNNGLIGGIDAGVASANGDIQIRLTDDTTLLDDAGSDTPIALQFQYSLSADIKLTFDLPRAFLPRAKASVQGPGGIDVTFAYQAARDANAGYLMRATLLNDLDGTQYVP